MQTLSVWKGLKFVVWERVKDKSYNPESLSHPQQIYRYAEFLRGQTQISMNTSLKSMLWVLIKIFFFLPEQENSNEYQS